MDSYQVLDLEHSLHMFNNEDDCKTMINAFALDHFKRIFQDYHKDVVAMNFTGLRATGDCLRSTFSYVTSPEMRILMLEDMKEAIAKKDEQKLIELHLIFLQNCLVLHRELEDYLGIAVPSENIRKCTKEIKKKYGIEEFQGEAGNYASCPGCNIF